jgi:GntR family transcriptional regulator of vanillate catabolism
LRHAQRQHREILNAIENREGSRAEALTREHARLALMNFNHLNQSRSAHAKNVPGLSLIAQQ